MNRKRIILLITFIMSFVLAIILTSCKNEQGSPKKTAEPTPTVERTPTPTPPPTATPAPTVAPLEDSKKGIPQEGAEELYRDEFTDDESNPSAIFRDSSLLVHHIENEQILFSHDGSGFVDNWESYAPDYYCEVGKTHNQYEFYVDMKTTFSRDDAWMSCFLGARVTEPSGSGIATVPEAGFFVAISKTKATVYPGTSGQWHQGVLSIDLPEPADTMHTYIVIDDGTCLYYYMVLSNGDKHLLLKADVSGENTIIFDKDGNELKQCTNSIKDNTSGYFKIFNHMGNTTADNIILKGNK